MRDALISLVTEGAGNSGYVRFDNAVVLIMLLIMRREKGIYGKLEKKMEQRTTTATNYAEKERKATLPATAAALQFGRLFLTVGEKKCS
ncbi:uncharacterized [Tachysurus ichikawai]